MINPENIPASNLFARQKWICAIILFSLLPFIHARNNLSSQELSNTNLIRVVALPFQNKTNRNDLAWLSESLPGVITDYINSQYVIETVDSDEIKRARVIVGRRSTVNRNILGTVATLTKAQVAIGGFYTWDEKTQKVIVTSYLYIRPLRLFIKLPPVETALESSELFSVMDKTADLISAEIARIHEESSHEGSTQLAFSSKPYIIFLACHPPGYEEFFAAERVKNPTEENNTETGGGYSVPGFGEPDDQSYQTPDEIPIRPSEIVNQIERYFSKQIVYNQSRQITAEGNCNSITNSPLKHTGKVPSNSYVYIGYIEETGAGFELSGSLYSIYSRKVVYHDVQATADAPELIEKAPEQAAENLSNFFKSIKYKISAEVSGLHGSGLVLSLNRDEKITVNGNGLTHFTSELFSATPYEVAIESIPETPRQNCIISNGSGVVSVSHVTNIEIFCVKERFGVHFEVSGLKGKIDISLDNNEPQNISKDGKYRFEHTVADQDSFTVKIKNEPSNQRCLASPSTRKINGEIAGILIQCRTITALSFYVLAGYPLWIGNTDANGGSIQPGQELPLSALGGLFNLHLGVRLDNVLPWRLALLLDIGYNSFSGTTRLLDASGALVESSVNMTNSSIDILPMAGIHLLPGKWTLMPLLGFGVAWQFWGAEFGSIFSGFIPLAAGGLRFDIPLDDHFHVIAHALARVYFLPTDQVIWDNSLSVGVSYRLSGF